MLDGGHDGRGGADGDGRRAKGFRIGLQVGVANAGRFQFQRARRIDAGVFRHDDLRHKVICEQVAIGPCPRNRPAGHQFHPVTMVQRVFGFQLQIARIQRGLKLGILTDDELSGEGDVRCGRRACPRGKAACLCIDIAASVQRIGNDAVDRPGLNVGIVPEPPLRLPPDIMGNGRA